jgi:hypothetical protein
LPSSSAGTAPWNWFETGRQDALADLIASINWNDQGTAAVKGALHTCTSNAVWKRPIVRACGGFGGSLSRRRSSPF